MGIQEIGQGKERVERRHEKNINFLSVGAFTIGAFIFVYNPAYGIAFMGLSLFSKRSWKLNELEGKIKSYDKFLEKEKIVKVTGRILK